MSSESHRSDARSASSDPAGINRSLVDPWLARSVPELTLPITYTLIAGGRSNLTYRIDDAGGHTFVLRRPPLGPLLPSAHDMAREHRIISALGPTSVPVAKALAFCDDIDISERPFYVMEFVDGLILRTQEEAELVPVETRSTISASLMEVLGDLHSLNVTDVGLGQLGKHEGYIARQLNRWHTQFTASKLREVPEVDMVFAQLSARIPTQQGVSIVHGDYRLDNTMVSAQGKILAVLDWEICTLGDPLADLGTLFVYSPEPGDPNPPLGSAPTMAPGFATKSQMLRVYEQRSGLDVSNIDYYVAFGYWKLACILDGVYTRYKTGAMGNDGFDYELYNEQVTNLAHRATAALATWEATS
jgi:aminoglycoside phosphotransferase (APT) family kinase protein